MCGLWDDWGAIDANDRASVCGREDVREHCIEWPRVNPQEFAETCTLIANFANHDFDQTRAKWEAYQKLQADSVNASCVLSGAVDVENLPLKKSKR